MPPLPALTARDVIRVLKQAGFVEDRQKGSHLVLFNHQTGARTVVPVHAGKTLYKPLVRSIIDDAKLSVEAFLKLL